MKKMLVIAPVGLVICVSGLFAIRRFGAHADSLSVHTHSEERLLQRNPAADAQPPDPISQATIDALQDLATQAGLNDFSGLQQVASLTVRAMASGDGPALLGVLLERGAIVDPARAEQLRNSMAESPSPPEGLGEMRDDQVIAAFNSHAKGMLQLERASFNAIWLGKRPGFNDADTFLTPPVSKTPNRQSFRGEPWRCTEMFYSSPVGLNGSITAPEVVVIEFAGTTEKGRMLVCVAFAYYPDTGWIPRAKACVGAPYLAPL
jgi:hypothetical protein